MLPTKKEHKYFRCKRIICTLTPNMRHLPMSKVINHNTTPTTPDDCMTMAGSSGHTLHNVAIVRPVYTKKLAGPPCSGSKLVQSTVSPKHCQK